MFKLIKASICLFYYALRIHNVQVKKTGDRKTGKDLEVNTRIPVEIIYIQTLSWSEKWESQKILRQNSRCHFRNLKNNLWNTSQILPPH